MNRLLAQFMTCGFLLLFYNVIAFSQLQWTRVDSQFGILPPSVHVYRSNSMVDGKPNIAYYVEADLNDRKLEFTTDTTQGRRLKPSGFYSKNDRPLVVVNGTFFSFAKNSNLNIVIRDGRPVSFNPETIKGRGADSLNFLRSFRSAIGIKKNRQADVAWIYSDSASKKVKAAQRPVVPRYPPVLCCEISSKILRRQSRKDKRWYNETFHSWPMQTAIGGGPVLIQSGEVKISNQEEVMFPGKALFDKHPRTAMGYTGGGKLIILVIEGRNPGIAEGASLVQEATILRDLGCVEALNLDGGGSSCMLINGVETIKPSEKEGQRAVPAVFIVKSL
ncbi:MAG: phosphodiester glycosidase family protein [Chitinophagaceae bacterium]|nr:phosphodiester glycosidase family protein [Chitinophagaceae bacterium]